MSVRALHRWALTAATALPIAGVMNGSALLLLAGGVMLLVLVIRGGNLFELPRSKSLTIAIHSATVALLVLAIVLFPRARVDAVLMVVMIGIFNRWILRGGHRDDLIILGASVVLLAAATTITPGIAFGAIIAGFVVFSMWAMLAASIMSLGERESSDEARRAAWQRLGRRPAGSLLGPIAGMSIAFTLIGSALMLFFPRYQFVRFLAVGAFMQLSGQADSMELRTDGVPGPGGGWVALRVQPSPGRSQQSLEALYALMGVLDQFDGRTWRSRIDNPSRELYLYEPRELYKGPKEAFAPDADGPNTMRVTMFRRVHARAQPHPVATLGRDRPSYVAMYGVRQSENGSIVRGSHGAWTQVVYKVDPDRAHRIVELSDSEERNLQLPPDLDPRVIDLAKRLTEGKTEDREKVQAILSFFNTNRFEYSLDPLEGESNDPLVRFLFEAKRGHCELYAGAVAVLLRLAGVKARVATGYYGGWWNSMGGYLELADVDAHAWVEAHYDGAWHWVDATPESRRARREEKALAWIYDAYDALEALWHANVISFDESERRRMMSRLGEGWSAFSGEWLEGGRGPATNASWVALGIPLAVTAMVLMLARKRRRRPEMLGLRLRKALGGNADGTLGRLQRDVRAELEPLAAHAIAAYERMRFGPGEDPRVVEQAIRRLEQRSAELTS